MGMKKSYKKIAMASAFAMTVGLAGNAFAVVDMDTDTGAVSFATEIDVLAAGTTLTNAASILDANVSAGFSIGVGTSKYIRWAKII